MRREARVALRCQIDAPIAAAIASAAATISNSAIWVRRLRPSRASESACAERSALVWTPNPAAGPISLPIAALDTDALVLRLRSISSAVGSADRHARR
jgi:hypothetical protein